MSRDPCGTCGQLTPQNITPLKCVICSKAFHKKKDCSLMDAHVLKKILDRDKEWICGECNIMITPFATLENSELIEIFAENAQNHQPKPNKKTKCGHCNKKVRMNVSFVYCPCCSKFFHIKCSDTKKVNFPLPPDWQCNQCVLKLLPCSTLSDNNLLLFLKGFTSDEIDNLSNLPSFNIQSLLDQISGQNFNTDEFLSHSINSKYYTPAQFISEKFSKKSFSLIHLNIASLQLHIDELRTLLALLNHPFDAICITETRLHDDHPLSNIQIEGYEFVHTKTLTQCGGAGIYIKSTIEYELLKQFSISNKNVSESIFLEIKNPTRKNIVIGCIYRHHTPVSDFLETFLNDVLEKVTKSNKICALIGDFNVDLIKYGNHLPTESFYDQISSYGFRPLVLQPSRVTTHSATLIDNIFLNDLECFSKGGNLTNSISDHFLQFCQIDIYDKTNSNKNWQNKFTRNWRIFNSREFEEELSSINWDESLNLAQGTEACFSTFFNKIEKLLDEMAPYKKLTRKEYGLKVSPWITNGIFASMRERDLIYKNFVKEKDPTLKTALHLSYKTYRNRIVNLIRISKKQYFADFFHEHHSNLKKTWDGIRDLINVSKKSSTKISKLIQDRTFTDNSDIANKMNDFFVNIGSSVEAKIPDSKKAFHDYLGLNNPTSLLLRQCSQDEVKEIIKNFSVSKASGPFSIPTKILKNYSHILINPLTTIINKSLSEGIFPSYLKAALVCPIFKKDDKTKCANYRPISLLSNIGKIFERVMYNRIEEFLNDSEIIYKLQFGFRKKYSTNHALLSIVEKIRANLDNKTFSCGVFVDLEKAFDTVNHMILLQKLEHYGIRDIANNWMRSYLTNRSQCVSTNGVKSKNLKVSCGVPQGSILGPLLFIIYINDMHKALNKCTVHHFADDTNLLFSDKSPNVIKKTMNKELALLFDWLCANRLSLNVGKTEFIIFRPPKMKLENRVVLTLNHKQIFESRKIKYLGLLMDDRLTWKFHINELCKKLNRSVGMLFKLRHLCPSSVLKSLYFSIFNSHMTYGLPVWGNTDKIYTEKINLLQKKAIRAITFSDFRAPSLPILKDLEILSFYDLYQYQIASLMWDHDHNVLPCSISSYFTKRRNVHSHSTRLAAADKLIIPKTNTVRYGSKSFKIEGAKMLNSLKEQNIYNNASSKSVFLKKLKLTYLEFY